MSKPKKLCRFCGGEFISWHHHKDCGKPETQPEEPAPVAQEPPKRAFRPRMMVGGAVIHVRSR